MPVPLTLTVSDKGRILCVLSAKDKCLQWGSGAKLGSPRGCSGSHLRPRSTLCQRGARASAFDSLRIALSGCPEPVVGSKKVEKHARLQRRYSRGKPVPASLRFSGLRGLATLKVEKPAR